ncbi:hypothetical protein DFS34DRAFT_638984 [Phlyctochytrium arcticum]|nr:hypothetical protein DFS34DRAFT_638984 [Phlyctochytrium arcticum]
MLASTTLLLGLLSLTTTTVVAQTPRENNFPVNQFPAAGFCASLAPGTPPSDGSQIRSGSCSSTPQGAIPSVDRMISALIIAPQNAASVSAKDNLTVSVDLRNLDTGFFADPQAKYYLQPQTLNGAGVVQGHSHITIQTLDSTTRALDATKFVFFKGLNEQSADGRTLSVTVPAGSFKVNGPHRICAMAGTNAHQPPVMPVAQRGAQDDCIRITVTDA